MDVILLTLSQLTKANKMWLSWWGGGHGWFFIVHPPCLVNTTRLEPCLAQSSKLVYWSSVQLEVDMGVMVHQVKAPVA